MTVTAPHVTAVVIARDEQDQLAACLRSLRFCGTVVVVIDARSGDRTEDIARRHADCVRVVAATGFDQLKNAGLAEVNSEWALSIDADERVTPSLAREIVLRTGPTDAPGAFRIPIRNFFFGHPMRHGGWTERPVRLFRRAGASFSGAIHETITHPTVVGELAEPIWHFSHRNIRHNWEKTGRYLEQQVAHDFPHGWQGVRSAILPLKVFLNRYVRHQGFRDGRVGLIEAAYQAASMLAVTVRGWELAQDPSIEQRYEQLDNSIAQMWSDQKPAVGPTRDERSQTQGCDRSSSLGFAVAEAEEGLVS